MSENDILSLEAADGDVSAPDTSDAGAVENSNDWRESLPEDLRNHGDIKSAESIADLAKRYTGARAKMSRMVNIPSHEAGSEEMSEFYDKVEAIDGVVRIPTTDDKDGWDKLYQRIGVPTDADQYAIEDKDLAGKLHALSLNGGQAEAVARMISGASETTKQAMEAVAQEGMADLKSRWGDKFEHNAKSAAIAFREFGGDEIFQFLSDNGLAGRAEMVEFGHNLSQKLAKGKLPMGDTTARYGTSPEEAREARDAIMNNPNDPYFDGNHPDHQKRTDTVEKYNKIIYPSGS